MFTVFASRNNEETLAHSYLLLSRPDSTMVISIPFYSISLRTFFY